MDFGKPVLVPNTTGISAFLIGPILKEDGGEVHAEEVPIIAWQVFTYKQGDGWKWFVEPVITRERGHGIWTFLKYPDGSLEHVSAVYPNAEAAIEEVRAQVARDEERWKHTHRENPD